MAALALNTHFMFLDGTSKALNPYRDLRMKTIFSPIGTRHLLFRPHINLIALTT